MSLELRGVSFRWPEKAREKDKVFRSSSAPALADASLTLERGASLALLGPNGAGKSTLLGLASGRLRPASGTVLLEGRALADWDRKVLSRRLAFLPQVERLPFNYSVADFVLLGRAPHIPTLAQPTAADGMKAMEALGELGIGRLATRPVTELSGGELQLVRLARCLAQEAEYLLLDEPSTMLDPANSKLVADALKSLARRGRGILFTTHDAAFAAFTADESGLLKAGSLVAMGPSPAILVPELLETAFGLPFKTMAFPSALS